MLRLAIFLSVFLSLYGAIHVLVYLGMRPLLPPQRRFARSVQGFMALMVLAPVLIRVLERLDLETAARLLAFIGYSWMAFAFLCFAGFLAVFAWDLPVRALARRYRGLSDWSLHGVRCALLVPLLALFLSVYGYYEAAQLRIETVTIATDKLPVGSPVLRIAQISDLHLGLIHRHGKLRQVAEQLQELAPDLLVATGDIVDARLDHLEGLADIFAELAPPLGKYAVTGNHEYYAGLPQALDFFERSGFRVLHNRVLSLGPLLVAGVDDPAGGELADEAALLREIDRKRFVLLLKHRPLVNPAAAFDLQLSGHAHRGQIVPFNLITALEYPLQNGLYRLDGEIRLYTSRGTGTWGPPIRIFSPPEITLIELRPAAP